MQPLRVIVLAVVLAAVLPAAGLAALPRTYSVLRVDSPNPIDGSAFGWGITSADFTGDGRPDLAVAQSQGTRGQIFVFDGFTGRHIDTIDPPESNPNGSDEVLAFVYVEAMPDIGSCPSGKAADNYCADSPIGDGDGIPEIVAGSRSLQVDADPVDGRERDASDPALGRAYVFDGRTRAVLKAIDMPVEDRKQQARLGAAPHFGRSVSSPQGSPPCAGPAGEANNLGVGGCAGIEAGVTQGVRIGDVDGGGRPDLVVTARNYHEEPATAFPGSGCATGTSACTAGRGWIYQGELIARTDPRVPLETAYETLKNPAATSSSGGEFGGNVFRIGDVGSCTSPQPDGTCTGGRGAVSSAQDGAPDVVIAARNLDAAGMSRVGAAFLFDGRTGTLLKRFDHPQPSPIDQFSGGFNAGPAVGDLGATGLPDIVLGAPFHNTHLADAGRAYVMLGDAAGVGGGGDGGWNFAQFDDPTPSLGENFGGATAGVGDLMPGPANDGNEILIGGLGPFGAPTEEARRTVNDVHIVNPQSGRALQSIPNPDNAGGDGFGVGIAPMGDLNDDGFLDFAVSAYLSSAPPNGGPGRGRVFLFTSNNAPPPPAPTAPPPAQQQAPAPAPTAQSPAAPVAPTLIAGRCANDALGSNRRDVMRGTIAGDRMFGFSGNDSISGHGSSDCLDGGRGRDRLNGGDGNDRLFGRSGNDRLYGSHGRDRLKGEGGRDVLSGGRGNDLLAGGPSHDRLNGNHGNDGIFGEAGNDRIRDRLGRNSIDAGPGNDYINVRNRRRGDTVRCGSGRDTVRADRSDRIGDNCERVIFESRKRKRRR